MADRREPSRLSIDLGAGSVTVDGAAGPESYPFESPEAFRLVSEAWLRVGWDQKYVYSFSWLGRPVIQLPDDLIRVQEVIATVRPDVLIETGVAHGGSLVFYATLCKALDRGRVVGVDIEIRPHNRRAIEEHPLAGLITLIEGDSADRATVEQVEAQIAEGETTLVLLDSGHSKAHVLRELRAYGDLVTPGSYLVVMDGIMERLAGAPRSHDDWAWNNPAAAISEFLREDSRFVAEEPEFVFNEGLVRERVTYWLRGYLKRVAE
jgi:cephalosporin hydroxylase